jgi:hypothetical protein
MTGSMNNNTPQRLGATIITSVALLVGAASAQAQPSPYERSKTSKADVVEHLTKLAKEPRVKHVRVIHADIGTPVPARSLRMIPRPGADGTNALCRSGSKAARWAC